VGNKSPSRLKQDSFQKESFMAYIIAEPCIGTKDTACVDVCPVDCIHPRKDEANFADFPLDDLPEKWKGFTPVNAEYYKK
jgi:NAD-dependent dihydropyrimidine dehydrogenase PreA subunit